MKHLKGSVGLGLMGFWILVCVLWPVPSNMRLERDGEKQAASAGEGLYKADLTHANFGLLGLRFYESSEGRKTWKIHSQFAELHRREKDYAFMKNVDADLFGATGNVVHTKSDYGRSTLGSHFVQLEGSVVITSEQGYRFTMDHMDFDSAENTLRTADPVNISGPDADKPEMFLTGVGLEGDLNEEIFHVKKNTRARRLMSNKEWIRVQSTQGEFRTQTKHSIFTDRARAVLPHLSVESDRLEMSLSGDDELLKAYGHVALKYKNHKGRSEVANIEISNDKIILEGHAEFESDDNKLTGRKITFYMNQDRVQVEQAAGSMAK